MTLDDKKLDEILDTVFANGITRGQQYAEGTGANTLMSDTLYTAKTALNRHYGGLLMEIIGADEELEPLNIWIEKTRDHGGTSEEYWKLYSIVNDYNNLRAELRASLKQRLGL